MISKDIVDYIKTQINKGQSKEDVKKALVSAGWQATDIEEAFKYAQSGIPLAPILGNMQNMSQSGQDGQNTQFLASPSDLLKEAWEIYKARFSIFANIIIISTLGSIIPAVIMVSILMGLGLFKTYIPERSFISGVNLPLAIIFIIFFIAIVILQFWSQAAMLFAIKDSGENIGVKESYRRGWKKIGSIFWVGLLSGIIVTGGYLLFVIPGIIFGVWFSLAAYIVIAEEAGGMNAILKSKEYVKGYWWEVLWRFIFIGLVVLGVNIVVMLIGLVIPVLPNLLMIFVTPLTVIYSFMVYKNLKAIKEAKGAVKSEFSSGEKIKFTVIGVLGVLAVFAILVLSLLSFSFASSILSTVSPDFSKAQNRAMDAKRQADMASLHPPLVIYADDHKNIFPLFLNELVPEYIDIIPVDPKTKLPFEYRQLNNGESFELCTYLSTGIKKCLNDILDLRSF